MPSQQSRLAAVRTCFLVALVAAAWSGQANGQDNWTPIRGSADESTVFVDLTRLQVSGRKVTAWTVHNRFEPERLANGKLSMSMVTHDEIDCAKMTVRGLQIYMYEQRFGRGRAVDSSVESDRDATVPPPNSVGEHVAKIVCDRAFPRTPRRQ